jgi:integrase
LLPNYPGIPGKMERAAMATINTHRAKDGSVSYRVRIQRKGHKVLTSTHPTLKDANRWATMVEGDIIAGRHFPTKSKHTLAELLDKYATDVMPRKSPETQRVQGYVITYWKRTLGHMLLDDIQPCHVIAARNAIAKKGGATRHANGSATIAKYLAVLSHAFTTAVKEYQWIETNPCMRVSKPPLPHVRTRHLSDEERTRLLQECRNSRNKHLYALVSLALATGLRQGSLLNLTCAMVDIEAATLHIPTSKSGAPIALPLVGEALELARELAATSKDGFLFPRKRGTAWDAYRDAFERAVARANLEGVTFHTLRHCVGSYLVQAGIPLYVVSQVLTHATVAMTARYSHLHTDNLRDALGVLADRLAK